MLGQVLPPNIKFTYFTLEFSFRTSFYQVLFQIILSRDLLQATLLWTFFENNLGAFISEVFVHLIVLELLVTSVALELQTGQCLHNKSR